MGISNLKGSYTYFFSTIDIGINDVDDDNDVYSVTRLLAG